MKLKKELFPYLIIYILCVYLVTPYEIISGWLAGQGSYFAQVFNLVIISLLLVAIVFGCKLRINKEIIYFFFLINVLIILSALFVSASLRILVVPIYILCAVLLVSMINNDSDFRKNIIKLVDSLISTYCLFFWLQFMTYHFFGYIDFHSIFFPWSAQRTQEIGDFARLGGIHIEPGTLAQVLFLLLVIRSFLKFVIMDKLMGLTLITMAFTLSAWGIVVSGFTLLMFAFGAKGLNVRVRIFALIILMGCLAFFTLNENLFLFIEQKLIFESGSGQTKLAIYDMLIDNFDSYLFFGLGFDLSLCNSCEYIKDAGLYWVLVLIFGFLVSFIVVSGLIIRAFVFRGLVGVGLVVIMFSTKLGLENFMVIFTLLLVAFSKLELRQREYVVEK